MTEISLHDFFREMTCVYDEEQYSVRDNGAVLRHSRNGKRARPTDDQWTFGKPNSRNGYMHIGSVRIHRIVATAFYGEPPTPEHVVDHIDTNRRNNRPENLRWLTRLENVLLNPITVKRIKIICGNIEAFLENPSKLCNSRLDPNFEWMRKVSLEEAQACRDRMHVWAKSDKLPSGGGSIGEWVFKPSFIQKPFPKTSVEAPDLVMAKTPGAAQRKWRIPTEFPCCPQKAEEVPISTYAANLTAGAIFSRNHLSTSMVLEAASADDGPSICVMCEKTEAGAVKPWSVAKVTFETGLYVHTTVGTFFTKEGAEKEFCLARGIEWTGGDTFDDFC
jgi:hypothetical protein